MNQTETQKTKPQFTYWHVWTDDDGVSHQTQCQLTNFESESMGGDAAPQWNNRLMSAEAKIVFAQLPVPSTQRTKRSASNANSSTAASSGVNAVKPKCRSYGERNSFHCTSWPERQQDRKPITT